MKAQNHIKIVWLFIVWLLVACGSKNNQQEQSFTHELQEQSFIQELNKMLDWPEGGTYSDEVMHSVFDFIKKKPQSLEYKFEEELPHIRIATSDDGNVRAYSLERHGFEGNPSWGFECKTLLQYRSGETVFCYEIEDFNGYITQIRHVDSNKFYLLVDFQGGISQGTHEFYSLSVYKVENHKLHKVNGAFVSRNNVFDNLEFLWDDFGGHLEIDFEKEDSAFIYNIFQKELFVIKGMPLAGKPLKYRQYCWNNRHFELKRDDDPVEIRNDNYFIRIERQSENLWTYKCWNGGEKQGAPDLIIENGTKQYWLYDGSLIPYDEWVTDDESSPLGEKYTFFNKGYRYEYCHGWCKGSQLEELYVYDSGENLLYYGDFEPVFQP